MSVKGYKVFNPDWTCRDFRYEVGKTFKHDGNIEMCSAGFHFCLKISDCFNYYTFDSNNKVAEVEAIGLVETQGNKSVTNEIKIIRELTWHEVLDLANTGKNCTGICNSGDYNSGSYNSGNHNSGYCNSGYYNSGNGNSGNWNSTDFSAGFFNSLKQPLYVFNKPTDMSRKDFNNLLAVRTMHLKFCDHFWVCSRDMTEEEKKNHPEYVMTDGYLKTVDFKTACDLMWRKMTYNERAAVKDIPNFDAAVFKEITGITVE